MPGGASRAPIMTAYRQQALACAAKVRLALQRPRDLKPMIPDAPKILHRNVYGWCIRIRRGSRHVLGAHGSVVEARVFGRFRSATGLAGACVHPVSVTAVKQWSASDTA